MQKKIVKASPVAFGHLMLEFEEGMKQLVHRGDGEAHQPKPGDLWPAGWSRARREWAPDRHTQEEGVTWPTRSNLSKSFPAWRPSGRA